MYQPDRGRDNRMDDQPTVLFVDDEPSIADGHAELLADEYRTLTAYDGATALDRVEEADVVCLDRRMPGTSGAEVLEALRDRGHDCPVVMLTAVEPDADVVEMGFDEYLCKPIDRQALRETIDRLLARSADVDDDVLDALGDPKTRRCLAALVREPRGAQDLADATGYSLTTVYRRLNALQQAGLIESRSTLDPDGDHYRTFSVVTERISIVVDDGVSVEVERVDESPRTEGQRA